MANSMKGPQIEAWIFSAILSRPDQKGFHLSHMPWANRRVPLGVKKELQNS